jgi:hypothetical protein
MTDTEALDRESVEALIWAAVARLNARRREE